jgi:hypothetical protein
MGDFGEQYIYAEITGLGLVLSRCFYPYIQPAYIRPKKRFVAPIYQSPGAKGTSAKYSADYLGTA